MQSPIQLTQRHRWVRGFPVAAAAVACAMVWMGYGCEGSGPGTSEAPDKSSLFSGKADEVVTCEKIGLEPGCDACEEFGWYGDGECDQPAIDAGLCAGPDPDCETSAAGCRDNCGDMVDVPAGSFWMGCNPVVDDCLDSAELPFREVTLAAFRIDKYDVTVARYKECVEAGACTEPRTTVPEEPHTITTETVCTWGVEGRDQHPVNCVDWSQAAAYCAWAGKRLPTEAEWEKAARGTDGRRFPWGNQLVECDLANFFPEGQACVGATSPVGSYPAGASPYGTLDMAGNVWQWVADWYDSDYYDGAPDTDPPGPPASKWRVLRGGSWVTTGMGLRTSKRGQMDPAKWDDLTGFRCASDN